MEIKHDRSYIPEHEKNLFIPLGYAEEDLYQLRFQFQYTEQEREQNKVLAETLSPEEWRRTCNEGALYRSKEMEPVMEALAKEFVCFQYDKGVPLSYREKAWDLFFWCNDFFNTTGGDLSGRDFSYYTLTFNSDMTKDERAAICDRVLDFLIQNFSTMDHLVVYVQYKLLYNDKKLRETVEDLTPKLVKKSIILGGHTCIIEKMGSGQLAYRRMRTKQLWGLSDTTVIEIAVKLGVFNTETKEYSV